LSRRLQISFLLLIALSAVFAFATTALSFLTARSSAAPPCTGEDVLLGFRIGILDLIVLPLFSFCFLAVLVAIAKGGRVVDQLKSDDVTVFELGAVRISHGAFVVGIVCLGFVAMNGFMAEKALTRYRQISHHFKSTIGATSMGNSEGIAIGRAQNKARSDFLDVVVANEREESHEMNLRVATRLLSK
jgi:hypothetical protein